MNLKQPSVMGIAGLAAPDPEPDTTDPTVVSATEISATLVDVLFDEAMDVATIQAGDFTIDGGLTVSGAVLQGDDVTVRLTTSSQTPSTTYTVTVSTVSDIAGNPIGSPNTAQFTGFVVADTTDPTVVSATEISATLVDVLFDEDMDEATIQAGDFSIDNGLTVSGAVLQGDDRTVRLTTSSQTPSTTYTVTVTNVSDIAGNSIGSPNSAQFTGYVVAAGVLFESSWNTATGTSDAAINDGGKWVSGYGPSGIQQDPYVSPGGPGGNNFLNMVSVGGGGHGNPYYMNWNVSGSDVFGDPDDLYVRCYFRMHQSHIDNFPWSNHNFAGIASPQNPVTSHYLAWNLEPGEWPELDTPFVLRQTLKPSDTVLSLYKKMETEKWYCFEVRIHKVDANWEEWYFRLDGVDVTSDFKVVYGPHIGKSLTQLYSEGVRESNDPHGNLWLSSYDNEIVEGGWDIAAVEVRDDTWPGLL